jgi:antitoxin PrlF
MHVTSNGRVTIPKAIRDRFGFGSGADVEFITNGTSVYVINANASRGEKLVLRMRGAARGGMTTDEVMSMTRGQ